MNKDQTRGSIKEQIGKVQEKTGDIFGSDEQRARGLQKQAEGRLQKAYGDVKAALANSKHS